MRSATTLTERDPGGGNADARTKALQDVTAFLRQVLKLGQQLFIMARYRAPFKQWL